jgi:Stage II sporulation protein E (SpoIIE)
MLLGVLGCPARWRRWLLAAGLLLVALAARPGWPLPQLVRPDGSFTPLLVALEVAAAAATALVAAVWYRWSGRHPTATRGWLTVTLVLSCYDLLFTALASKRFEPIWWASLFTRSLTYAVLLGGLIAATAQQLVRVEAYVDAELGRAESVARSSLAVTQRLLAAAQALAGSVTVREVAGTAARAALDAGAGDLGPAARRRRDRPHAGDAGERRAIAAAGGRRRRRAARPRPAARRRPRRRRAAVLPHRQEVDAQLGAALEDPGVAVASLAALPLPVGALLLWGSTPHHLGQLERELLTGIANQAGQALVRARLYEQQHSVAETLQRGLLPDRLPDRPEVRLASRYVPGGGGAEIGGDWYDAMELADGLLLLVGDVRGKGAAAAHMMGQIRAAVRAFALLDPEPVAVLAGLGRMMAGFGPEQFVTIGCALLDPPGGRVTLARAGHLPVLVAAPGERPWYCESDAGPPLGAPDPLRHQTDLVLPAGALLALYSDGLAEDRIAGLERGLASLLESAATRGDDDLEALADRMLGGRPHFGDDVTLLLAEVGGTATRTTGAGRVAVA